MTTFLEHTASDMDVFFDKDGGHAEEITYRGETILAIEDAGIFGDSGSPGVLTGSFTLIIQESDVSRPVQGDAVVFRSKNYNVVGVPSYDGGTWRVEIMHETKNKVSV
jgi:hypothetical protein